MNRYLQRVLSLLAVIIPIGIFAQIPSKGDSTTLEIANWNIEWFGKTGSGYGPDNEVLQRKNILRTVRETKIDLWALCEISDINAFDTLTDSLPEYGSAICNYLPEQKTGLLYSKKMFELLDSRLLATANKDSFSTGRFPFLVILKPLFKTSIDTLFVIVVHLKANYGTNTEKLAAYNSRIRSAEWLQMFLSSNMKNRYCIVAGDWNDDIDESIYNALPTPYAKLRDNTAGFTFLSKQLTDNHIATTTGYPEAIDHQYASARLSSLRLNNFTSIINLTPYITSYASTTSDHFPVYSVFSFKTSRLHTTATLNPVLYPNPALHSVTVKGLPEGPNNITLYNACGECVWTIETPADHTIMLDDFAPGFYRISIRNFAGVFNSPLMIVR